MKHGRKEETLWRIFDLPSSHGSSQIKRIMKFIFLCFSVNSECSSLFALTYFFFLSLTTTQKRPRVACAHVCVHERGDTVWRSADRPMLSQDMIATVSMCHITCATHSPKRTRHTQTTHTDTHTHTQCVCAVCQLTRSGNAHR